MQNKREITGKYVLHESKLNKREENRFCKLSKSYFE